MVRHNNNNTLPFSDLKYRRPDIRLASSRMRHSSNYPINCTTKEALVKANSLLAGTSIDSVDKLVSDNFLGADNHRQGI